MSYVRAAAEMPFLTDQEVEQKAIEYGFVGRDSEATLGEKDAVVASTVEVLDD